MNPKNCKRQFEKCVSLLVWCRIGAENERKAGLSQLSAG
jgi:hypothetical protein